VTDREGSASNSAYGAPAWAHRLLPTRRRRGDHGRGCRPTPKNDYSSRVNRIVAAWAAATKQRQVAESTKRSAV